MKSNPKSPSIISFLILSSEKVEKSTCPLISSTDVLPIAMSLALSVVAPYPIAVWLFASTSKTVLAPKLVFCIPVVMPLPDWYPTAVLYPFALALSAANAPYPTAVLYP